MEELQEGPRTIPVVANTQVLVVGGGPAGIAAAVGAARRAARTMLVERWGFLGGAIAGTLVESIAWYRQPDMKWPRGIAGEIEERLAKVGGVYRWGKSLSRASIDSDLLRCIADGIVGEAGVKTLFHTWVVDVIKRGGGLCGVIIENKDGRGAILAERVIDATGDADLAARAGAPFRKGRPSDGLTQPLSNSFNVGNIDKREFQGYIDDCGTGFVELIAQAREDGKFDLPKSRLDYCRLTEAGELTGINITRVQRLDGVKTEDLSRAEIACRRQALEVVQFMREYIPGCQNAILTRLSPVIGVRETRSIIGHYELTLDDVLSGAQFEDGITSFPVHIDIHDPETRETHFHSSSSQLTYQIPYRCLIPRQIDKLLVAGRCISADHNAHGTVRHVYACFGTGQAAGTASALCLRDDVPSIDVDIKELKSILHEAGVVFQ